MPETSFQTHRTHQSRPSFPLSPNKKPPISFGVPTRKQSFMCRRGLSRPRKGLVAQASRLCVVGSGVGLQPEGNFPSEHLTLNFLPQSRLNRCPSQKLEPILKPTGKPRIFKYYPLTLTLSPKRCLDRGEKSKLLSYLNYLDYLSAAQSLEKKRFLLLDILSPHLGERIKVRGVLKGLEENFGGAGLRARQDNGRPGTASTRRWPLKKLFQAARAPAFCRGLTHQALGAPLTEPLHHTKKGPRDGRTA